MTTYSLSYVAVVVGAACLTVGLGLSFTVFAGIIALSVGIASMVSRPS